MGPSGKSETGKSGEDAACAYLVEGGYRVLMRNYRKPWGEIDVVAKSPDGTIVFVEVKTMKDMGPEHLTPEDNLSGAKFKKLARTCQMFAAKHEELVSENKGWRIDLIAITVDAGLSPSIRHYENIT